MSRSISKWTLLVAPLALFALLFVACGDDDNGGSSGGSSGGGGTGNDKQYVADICKASKKFSDSVNALVKDPSILADPKKAADKLGTALSTFANDFAKANPPADVKTWHTQAANEMKQLADKVKAGSDLQQVFGNNGAPFADPPKDIEARLSKEAATNKDCADTGTFK